MKEKLIRPENLIQKYFELCKQDEKFYFNSVKKTEVNCVACNSKLKNHKYFKGSFGYASCLKCGTLYNNFRPSIKHFENFYKYSESSKYWANVFLPKVAKTRIKKIFKPNAKKIHEYIQESKIKKPKKIIDVGAGQGLLLDELSKIFPKTDFFAIEPSKKFSDICKQKGYHAYNNILEKITFKDPIEADISISNEVIEHVYSPYNHIKKMKKITRKGGLIIFTTLTIDGFDLMLLGNKSSQILPPHHINFLSLKGFEYLSKRLGLKLLKIETPGKMDIDIVNNNFDNLNSSTDKLFVKFIIENNLKNKFQHFLQKNNHSSHVWVYLRNE